MRPPSVQILISETSTHRKEAAFDGEMTNSRSEERKAQGKSGISYCSKKQGHAESFVGSHPRDAKADLKGSLWLNLGLLSIEKNHEYN